MKKQTQFAKGQNERKTSDNKGIREINWIGHLVKTNPIQTQFYLAPRILWELKKQSQFTNGQNEHKCLYERAL